jgi:hypothetical protein
VNSKITHNSHSYVFVIPKDIAFNFFKSFKSIPLDQEGGI